MPRWLKMTLLPATAAAFAAFVSLLPQTGADREINMVRAGDGWAYTPRTVRVAVGARVAFENPSRVTHTATCLGCSQATAWSSGDVQPGQQRIVELRDEGRFQFFCRYHGRTAGMTGELVVGNPPASSPTPEPSPTG